jgi:hypothetical protein
MHLFAFSEKEVANSALPLKFQHFKRYAEKHLPPSFAILFAITILA